MFRYAFFLYSEVGDLYSMYYYGSGAAVSPPFRSMVDMAPAAAGGGEEGERFSGT